MKWRRRQYLIDHRFQWRFVRRLLIPLIIGVVTITLVDYYFIWSLFSSSVPYRYENMEFTSLKISLYLLFYGLCIFIPMVIIIGIIVSHRIAGPLFHIERQLRSIADGDLTPRVLLRQRDELKNLAMGINEMVEALSSKLLDIEREVKLLEEKLASLEEELGKELPSINRVREEVKGISSSFNTIRDRLARFKK